MKNRVYRKKIPGFTIIEMLFVMLLGVIVIGITYLYFGRFQQYLGQISHETESFLELGQLNTQLQKEFDQAEEIYFQAPDQLTFRQRRTDVEYTFHEDLIIRQMAENRDTFFIPTARFRVKEMEEYNMLVSNLSFDIETSSGLIIQFLLNKEYTAKTLVDNYKY